MADPSERRAKPLANPIPHPPRGLGAGEGSSRPVHPCVSCWDPSWAQILDSVLGLGALGLTIGAIFSMAGPALLLLLLLISFLTFDLLHSPTLPRHRLLPRGQSQGAGEGPEQQVAPFFPTEAVPRQLSLQDALLLLLLSVGLLLGVRGMPLALLGLAFCLHPWI
ncbi:uncharacterized protein C20orf141 homolog [Perognathus longimembris pacificus]|uniref:uncharacterized protein C20orf141 homolog n=1 Tax=Perognathus longimembris pacificus TaxID=214514 RepID=UPI00201A0DA0|nr:uncharacterized protein C20orf141 homolog [Perognathus longimembris pacificus]